MDDTDRVLEILERWDELRREGKEVAPEELCRDCPELLDAVKREIRDLERLGPLFEPTLSREVGQPELPATVDYVPSAKDGDTAALPGWRIGKYRVVERLGRGGQAEVFRAVHPNLPGRDVVIKWANKHLSPALQQQLLEEGRALAHLEDAGLARVYDVDEHKGRPFIVMEFVRGRTLQQQLAEGRPSPRQAAALAAQLARTLERVHRQGICHRDLKPANILIDAAGRPRVLDFGLALLDQPWEEPRRREGDVSGTFQYMAPEQANGETGHIGPRTDVFGLGAILFALLTGRPPYQDADSMKLWEQARQGKVTPPRQVQATVPQGLEKVCLKALACVPEQRFASAGEMARALEGYLRRRAVLAGLGLVGLFILLALGIALGIKRDLPTDDPRTGQAPLAAKLDVRVWKEADTSRGLALNEAGALPLRAGDWMRIEAEVDRPAYLYVIYLDAQGKASPMYPWRNYDWNNRPAERPVASLHLPENPLVDGAPLDPGPSGIESVVLLVRPAPLSPEDHHTLARLFATVPSQARLDPLRGAVWLEAGGAERFGHDQDRGRPNLDAAGQVQDPVERMRGLLRGELRSLSPAGWAVCYPFQGQ